MNNKHPESRKAQLKHLKKENEILQKHLTAYENYYLRQIALMEHIKRVFIYEISEEKWERVISSPVVEEDLERLREIPVPLPPMEN